MLSLGWKACEWSDENTEIQEAHLSRLILATKCSMYLINLRLITLYMEKSSIASLPWANNGPMQRTGKIFFLIDLALLMFLLPLS